MNIAVHFSRPPEQEQIVNTTEMSKWTFHENDLITFSSFCLGAVTLLFPD